MNKTLTKEALNLLKLRKMSTFAWTIVFLIAIFAVSITATVYYYYGIPHPAHLRILHTHPHQMVNEVTNDFKAWYQQKYGRPIDVTLTLTDPQSAFKTVTTGYIEPEADIWWGGPFSLFEEAGNSLLSYNSTQRNEINATCYSCPLMDLRRSTPKWYAASLYGLGVMYNEYALNSLNLQLPQNWSDLLRQEYEGNITMVDPTRSEFTEPFIMLIIQNRIFTANGVQNWIQGWEFLVRLSAFVKKYDNSETQSALKVAAGHMPLAVLPDFYAYDKMAAYPPNVGFTYLDATILQPDPVAILNRTGTHTSEAKAFIDYLLTEQAQNIIGRYRLPVHKNATVSSPRINPFSVDFPHIQGYNSTFQEIGREIVKDYYQAWITERHGSIKAAWNEIKEANKTVAVNPNVNATYYYRLAWNNFTYAGHNTSRAEVDILYNETKGWTENVITYLIEWQNASAKAYDYALENAKKSKEAAE